MHAPLPVLRKLKFRSQYSSDFLRLYISTFFVCLFVSFFLSYLMRDEHDDTGSRHSRQFKWLLLAVTERGPPLLALSIHTYHLSALSTCCGLLYMSQSGVACTCPYDLSFANLDSSASRSC